MQRGSRSSAELPVVSIAAARRSKSTADSRIQTCWVPRSSSLSFVLLHVGNCSSHFSPWQGSSALEKIYFFNGSKSQSYIELKIPIMDTCLPESPSWSVVFPVMMPVSFAVCSKTIHIHLGSKRELVLQPGKQLVFIWNVEETLLILSLSIGSSTWGPRWCAKLFCCMRWCNHRVATQGLLKGHYILSYAETTTIPEPRQNRKFLSMNSCLAIWKPHSCPLSMMFDLRRSVALDGNLLFSWLRPQRVEKFWVCS